MPRRFLETLAAMSGMWIRWATRVDVVGMQMPGVGLPRRVQRIMLGIAPTRLSRTRLAILSAACIITCVAFAAGTMVRARQSPASADRQAFDAASIKPSKSAGPRFAMLSDRYSATGVSVRVLIANAYQLSLGESVTRIFGVPKSMDAGRFDVDAEAEDNPTPDQKRLMLQSLLADRFKLLLHRETRQLPIYALVVAKPGKTGPQFKPHSDDSKCSEFDPSTPPAISGAALIASCGGVVQSGRGPIMYEAGNKITTGMMAKNLSAFLDRPVLDRTGLTGTFDLTLNFAFAIQQGPGSPGAAVITTDPSGAPSLFTALEEQLGLKLESTKGPVDVLVIDHIEEPSPN